MKVTRAERVTQIAALREAGLTARQIGAALGITKSAVRSILNDPDGSKQRERRMRYQGTCEDCGAATDGSNGIAKAPRFCDACVKRRQHEQALIDNPHGTRNRYGHGCRCDPCVIANREYVASLKTGEAPNHGTYSGYTNYGCRCDECREAKRAWDREHPQYRQRWVEKNPDKVREYRRRRYARRKVPCTACGKLRSGPNRRDRRYTGLCLSCWVASDEFREAQSRGGSAPRRQAVAA